MKKSLSKQLKQKREDLFLSQEYVAKQLGIELSSLIAIENNKREISATELERFSELFLVPVEELVSPQNQNLTEIEKLIQWKQRYIKE